MKQKRIPDDCKGCPMLHTTGLKDGIHNRWCIRYSQAAAGAIGHCRTMGTVHVKPAKTGEPSKT